jgi:hypothetical protein
MSSCSTSNNPLDPVGFNYDRDVNIQAGSTCDQDSLSCSDIVNLCLCNNPEIQPPVLPDNAKCVNDIIKRPWPPPPPANPGCNPVSINVTNRQDTSVAPSENIRLKGTVGYVGEDPCLPEINLELITNPDFRSGGANPVARGWGVGRYGLPAGNINLYRILPAAECPDLRFNTPQDFLAREPGAEHFLPQPDLNCNTPLDVCKYRQAWADKMASWGLIGPRLVMIHDHVELKSTLISIVENGQFRSITVPFAWTYTVRAADCVVSGNVCHSSDICRGTPFGPFQGPNSTNLLTGMENFNSVYNIKENLVGYEAVRVLSPGVNLQFAVQNGLMPQPIQRGSLVLMYGWVPWGNRSNNYNRCDCEIQWFIDVPNALAGQCRTDDNPDEGLASMIPTRTVNSAGMFFGGAVDGARV